MASGSHYRSIDGGIPFRCARVRQGREAYSSRSLRATCPRLRRLAIPASSVRLDGFKYPVPRFGEHWPSKIAQALKEWFAASSSTTPIPGVAACATPASLHLALAPAFANACAHKRLWRADTIVSAVPTAPRNDTCLGVVREPAGEVAAGSNNPESSFGTSVPSRTCLNANEQGIKHPHAESLLQWCRVTDANENMQ